MQYFTEIIPLLEARIYLMERFTENRTSDRILHFEPRKDYMSVDKWTYFYQIIEIQNQLDELIHVDELFKYYFMPRRTKDVVPGDRSITLGGMLLCPSPSLVLPVDYNDFISYCKNAPQKELLDGYFVYSLSPFYTDNCELDTIDMSKIIAVVNSIFADNEDKWAVIDCISNPCDHLEKMRPLVEKVMYLITEKCHAFSEFIATEMNLLCSNGSLTVSLQEVLRREIKPGDLDDAKIYPCLLSFNSTETSFKRDSFKFNRIILGIYINTLIELRKKANNADIHIQLLKMLSDSTRFKLLHELCNRQTFGQELADKFGGARSAIYYHLEKLLGCGLIDLEMTEYRMLYTMNKQNVYDKMNAIRDYLLDGWKPGDTSAETEKTAGENQKINA